MPVNPYFLSTCACIFVNRILRNGIARKAQAFKISTYIANFSLKSKISYILYILYIYSLYILYFL